MKKLSAYENLSFNTRQSSAYMRAIQKFSKCGDMTIPEFSTSIGISVPTGTKIINDLLAQKLLICKGKREQIGGRPPLIYGLNKDLFKVVAVEILLKRIRVGILNVQGEWLAYDEDGDFRLKNSQESLDFIVKYVQSFLKKSNVVDTEILGVGVSLVGMNDIHSGKTYSYFDFLEEPLTKFLSGVFQKNVYVENDSYAYGLAETKLGGLKDHQNGFAINLSRGLGMALLSEGHLHAGSNGFAGEFGHMQFGNGTRMCVCRKTGCLGTEASGFALEMDYREHVASGEQSSLTIEDPRYDDIIKGALKGDELCIKLVYNVGEKLGFALGNVINLLNPEIIIIGGKLARSKDLLLGGVMFGTRRSALTQSMKNCKIELSKLDDRAGVLGAGLNVFTKYELL